MASMLRRPLCALHAAACPARFIRVAVRDPADINAIGEAYSAFSKRVVANRVNERLQNSRFHMKPTKQRQYARGQSVYWQAKQAVHKIAGKVVRTGEAKKPDPKDVL